MVSNPILAVLNLFFNQNYINLEILVLVFIFILLLPFLPSIIEIFRGKERTMDINLLYSRDPAFWGNSYLKLLSCTIYNNLKGIKTFEDLKKISKELIIEMEFCFDKGKDKFFISKNLDNLHKISKFKNIDFVVIAVDNSVLSNEYLFNKELVVFGDLNINHSCFFNSLIVVGNLYVNSKTKIARYLHVDGFIYINQELEVGNAAYSSKGIIINAPFHCKKIFSPKNISGKESNIEQMYNNIDDNKKIEISGNIKIEGKFSIDSKEKYVKIDGNLVCDSDLFLKGNIWVTQNIFSQENVFLFDGVVVGTSGKYKSVVARKNIKVSKSVKVYGYLHSEKQIYIIP